MKNIIYLLIILAMAGCVTQKKCNEKFPPEVITKLITKDTTVYRDTTVFVYIKPDTVRDTVLVYTGQNGLIQSDVSFLQTQYANSRAWVRDGKLLHTLMQNEAEIAKTIKAAIKESQSSTVQEVVKIPDPVITNILKGWQWFLIWVGGIALIVLALAVAYVFIIVRSKIL